MATSRANATTDQDALLKQQFIHPATRVPIDPDTVRLVELIDTDGATVLETYDAIVGGDNPDIANPVVGTYQVTAAAADLDAAGTYYDKWYYTIDPGDDEVSHTNSFVVADPAAVPQPGDPGTSTVRVDVADKSVTPNLALANLEVLAFETDTGQRIDTKTTDAAGRAYFILKDGTKYTFSIRDPQDAAKEFDQNNVDHTVVDDDHTDAQDPNVISINGASVSPPWDPGTPLAADDLCTVSATFVDLEGKPLQGVEVRVRNNFKPSIRATKGVMGDNVVKKTDSAGKVSLSLVRTAEVTVSIQGTGITRNITIPDAASTDLTTLLGNAEDLFTVIKDDTLVIPPRAA